MAVSVYWRQFGPHAHQTYYVADTLAELPTSGVSAGSMGYAADTLKHYFFNGTVWAVRSNYALAVQAGIATTMTDAQTLFFGAFADLAPQTTGGEARIYIPRAGIIRAAYITSRAGTAGTAESWTVYIRKNNSADTTIAAVAASATVRTWSSVALSLAVAQGDYIEIKSINPTWATNPANVNFGGHVLVEES